jgi:integrase
MANYYFRLRDTTATKQTPIILYAQINGNRIKCKTNETILPANWDHAKKWPIDDKENKAIAKENKNLINTLTGLLSAANNAYLYFKDTLKDHNPETEKYQNKFYEVAGIGAKENPIKNTPGKYTLFQFVDKFIIEAKQRQNEHTGAKISENTIKMYNQCKRLLKEFNDTKYKLDFNKINLDFLLDFKEFLNGKQYATNTVAKHIITLKTFLNEANERGYYDNMAHKSKRFRAIQVQSETIYLTDKELNEIYKLDLSKKPKLERARDLFLVGCYTGLRFSDFTNIEPENIKGGFIEITTKKTCEPVVIPIHTRINEIMSKYEGKYVNSLPPAISNQKLNEYLKELCELVPTLHAPIDKEQRKNPNTKTKGPKLLKPKKKFELVCTHTARRSFATNNYNNGISANILMKITGHKTEKSFYKYIRVTPKENAQRLRDLWNLETSLLKVV